MIITKILETSIDLFEPSDIYSLDVKKLLMQKLSERYCNKCFSSILILKILDIIRYSDRIMVDNRLDGGAYINVQFKVEGVILVKGEILQGCKVINVASHGIIIDHPYAFGSMKQDPQKKAIAIIKKDQIVPVIVDDVRYNVGKSRISIMCTTYTPQSFLEILYNITEILSPADTEKLDLLLLALADEEKIHESLNSEKSYDFFKKLIYPYKTQRKFQLSPIGSNFKNIQLTLKNILEIRDGCITNADSAINEFLLHSKKTQITNAEIQVIDSPLYPAIISIIQQRITYLITLRGFVEYYNTIEKNQEMMAYWQVCMSLKK